MRSLISRYPDFLAGSAEFRDIQEAMEPEVLALWEARDGLLAQLEVETATWGLKYWETSLALDVDESKDADYRRSRIKAKLRGAGVTTVALVQNVAESFSNGAVSVTEYPAQYRIEIKFTGTIGVPPNMEDLSQSLRESLPAHLKWDYIFVYNTHAAVSRFTHMQLHAYTHYQLRNEVLTNEAN